MPKCEQQKVQTPGSNQRFYVLGVANALSGQFTAILSHKHRSIEFLGLVDTLLEVYPTEELYVVMDNSKIHDSVMTTECLLDNEEKYHRFHRVFLPTYSPWLNPIERFWRFMRRRLTHDYFFSSLEQLKKAAINFFAHFAQPNEKMLSIFSL